jgi:triacylglycerol lipase
MTLAALLGMTLAGCGDSAPGAGGTPRTTGGTFEAFSYTNDFGTRSYKVFVPARLPADRPAPLIVELHGCGGDADEEARWSRFNAVAGARGYVVVYPEQDPAANGSRCWNWFQAEHQARDAGEPSLIAGITREVAQRWRIDPDRIYIGGISAGGAMTVVMLATYPDLYAAAMVYAGCEYMGLPCLGSVSALPPEESGRLAYEAAQGHGRVVPALVVQGDADPLVPFPNAELVVQQLLATNDWADDGANNGSVARGAARTDVHHEPGRHRSSIDTYTDAAGCVLAQRWRVSGLGHAWSAGESNGSPRDELFTDPLGPDVTTAAVDFFSAQARGARCLPREAQGPPLTVHAAALHESLACPQPLAPGDRAVLLVHGTSVTPEENWGWNWQRALPELGFKACTVRLPDYAFVDIQESSEYVVHAIRAMSDATGTKIGVVGLSQGGMQPRWAIRWWPDIRERVDDLVMLATTNHGAAFADAACAASPCLPALWQLRWGGSNFLRALNAGDETPGDISYTSIYSLTDVVIQPVLPRPPAALDGAVNVAVQDFCPGRPVDHAQHAYDAAVWALAYDALSHEGPLDPARVDPAVCAQAVMPHADPAESVLGGANIYLVAGERQGTYAGKVEHEPPLREYARGEASREP